MNKKWIGIIISFLIVTGVSIFLYQLYLGFLLQLAAESPLPGEVRSEPPTGFQPKLFIQSFAFLFVLGCMPFVLTGFATTWKISKQNFWVPVLILEMVGLILAYVTSPPDLFSTIVIFVIWQLAVLVNLICLWRITKKLNNFHETAGIR